MGTAVVKLVSVDRIGVMARLAVVLAAALVVRRVVKEEPMVELANRTAGVSMTGRVLCLVGVAATLMLMTSVRGEMTVAVLREGVVSRAELTREAALGTAVVEMTGTGVA